MGQPGSLDFSEPVFSSAVIFWEMSRLFSIWRDRVAGGEPPFSVQSHEIIGHEAALDRDHGSRRNAFGLVVMGPMQQISGSNAKPETEGGGCSLTGRASGNQRPDYRIGFPEPVAQSLLGRNRVNRDLSR